MSSRVPQEPSAAYLEDYDEDAGQALPDTRRVANISAKRSRSDLKSAELGFDFASDSGYSSRTAATGHSGQSVQSSRESRLTAHNLSSLHTSQTAVVANPEQSRSRESRKDKGKQREERRALERMRSESTRQAHAERPSRSPSKSRRRESGPIQHPPDCWHCVNVNGYYQTGGRSEAHPADYLGYYYAHSSAVQEYPVSSPTTPQYPYQYEPSMQVAQRSQRRPSRSTAYHSDPRRPLSYHGGMPPESIYAHMPVNPYEHGPPPSASAYSNMSSYGPPHVSYHQQYYADPGSPVQAIYERTRSHGKTRTSERTRRPSVYGPPVVEQRPATPTYDDEYSEQHTPRDRRARRASRSYADVEEDYYRMPPPSTVPPTKQKEKARTPAQIIQKRPDSTQITAVTNSMPPPLTRRRMSQSQEPPQWTDFSELKRALPDREIRKIAVEPERSHNGKGRRRTTSYHEVDPPRRISIETPGRRRRVYYEDASPKDIQAEIEEKSRSAEEYQASRTGRPMTLTTEDLLNVKMAQQRPESDSGSVKSRTNSSPGSDVRTRDGSGVGSKYDDEGSFTMTMNGMTMSFTQESVSGKRIHLRTGEQGSLELNIQGRRPRKYIMPAAHSDYTSTSSRKDTEERRTREERRSDRASRRSTPSTFSSGGYD
ncbi:hypothetical protein VTN31DRAFT_7177 [Thermomyces dupontii]|uniref:uncharacterized protein n=1 Tax=Talaromyces thermophilus TaxID=28565 RepID=UPI00374347F0